VSLYAAAGALLLGAVVAALLAPKHSDESMIDDVADPYPDEAIESRAASTVAS
jgi:hypothetical protein